MKITHELPKVLFELAQYGYPTGAHRSIIQRYWNEMITENFRWREFLSSNSASRSGIDNIPNADAIWNIVCLCRNVMEPIRSKIGGLPIFVTSGYRSVELNRLIGGQENSQHCLGQAADWVPTKTLDLKGCFIDIALDQSIDFDQIIYEFGEWIHVSHNPYLPKQRRKISVAYSSPTKTVYEHLDGWSSPSKKDLDSLLKKVSV